MPLLSSHHPSYISVSLCLPQTADTPTNRLLWLLHFCLAEWRQDRFILGLCSAALRAGMAAASLIFLGTARVWEQGMSHPLWVAVFILFFLFFVTCGLTHWHQPASGLQPAQPKDRSRALHWLEASSILRSGL